MPLSYDEVENRRGYMVALDAEFVALSREETEIRTDGTRSLIRPVRLHLARVSLIRGQDFHEGVCFVDDYISTSVSFYLLLLNLF
jgi:PAB-dependent poly(A)-specific ribonuclease subunit 2